MRFLLALILLSGPAAIQAVCQHHLKGTVKDGNSGRGLAGAIVTLHELNRNASTDSLGRFEFTNLRSATYHLHISFVGYAAETQAISVRKESDSLEFYLFPTSIELKEIIVESNHYKTGAKEHTLAVEILDSEYLRQNRKNTFANSLDDLPGINSINTGVGIAKPVIRGLSSNRIIVNDKGIKQEGQQWGGDHGLEIDLFDPGRVEIIKGPGSLLYGSDGLGGVINIFPPALPADSAFSGSFQSIYKSNNHLAGFSGMVQGAVKDRFFRARLSTQDFGDYKVTADAFTYNSYRLPIYDRRLKNTAGNERNFSLMTGIKKNWGYSTITVSNFHQKAALFAGAVGIPRAYQLTPDGSRRNIGLPFQRINHFKIVSNSSILLGKNWAEVDLGYQHNLREEHSDPHAHGKGARPEGTMAHGLRLRTLSLNTRYFQHPSEKRSRISGIQLEAQMNQREGFEFLLPRFKRFAAGAFLFEELNLAGKYTLNGGIRADYGTVSIERSEEPIYLNETTIGRYYQRNAEIHRNFFNLSGGWGISYYPHNSFNGKLNLGTSFRMPAPGELSMNGIHHGTFRHELGDSSLVSERGYQADLNFSLQKKYLSVVVSLFGAYYHHYIYLAPTTQFSSSLDPDAFPEGGQIFRYRQNNVLFGGGEIAADYHPVHSLHIKGAFESVYNYNLNTTLPLPFTPPLSVLSEISYEIHSRSAVLSGSRVGISLKKTWAQRRVDRNERPTDGYFLLGASIGTSVVIKRFTADLHIAGDNLTNTFYLNHLSRYKLLNLPEQGRNFSISLNIPFATL